MEIKQDINIAREVLRLRLSQMIVNEKYKAGLFKIPIHLAMGHEAIAVAVDAIMEGRDQLICSHRNIHYNLARTKSLRPILDEYFLKKEGLAAAELGSMNLANEKKNIVYTSSILGNNLPVAAGLALSQKVRFAGDSRGLVIVVTGDGAMEEGSFYESLLFLKSNSLATLILVENNGWSMHTKIDERRSHIDLPKFTASLGAGYEKLSGNDPYHYIKSLTKIKEKVLKNKVPVVLEVSLTTLGGWYVEVEGNKEGRFIHPHAGPLPKTALADWPEIEQTANDPVFTLKKHFDKSILEPISRELLKSINDEIKES